MSEHEVARTSLRNAYEGEGCAETGQDGPGGGWLIVRRALVLGAAASGAIGAGMATAAAAPDDAPFWDGPATAVRPTTSAVDVSLPVDNTGTGNLNVDPVLDPVLDLGGPVPAAFRGSAPIIPVAKVGPESGDAIAPLNGSSQIGPVRSPFRDLAPSPLHQAAESGAYQDTFSDIAELIEQAAQPTSGGGSPGAVPPAPELAPQPEPQPQPQPEPEPFSVAALGAEVPVSSAGSAAAELPTATPSPEASTWGSRPSPTDDAPAEPGSTGAGPVGAAGQFWQGMGQGTTALMARIHQYNSATLLRDPESFFVAAERDGAALRAWGETVVRDPVEGVKAAVGYDELIENPARWAGARVPGAVLGAGAAGVARRPPVPTAARPRYSRPGVLFAQESYPGAGRTSTDFSRPTGLTLLGPTDPSIRLMRRTDPNVARAQSRMGEAVIEAVRSDFSELRNVDPLYVVGHGYGHHTLANIPGSRWTRLMQHGLSPEELAQAIRDAKSPATSGPVWTGQPIVLHSCDAGCRYPNIPSKAELVSRALDGTRVFAPRGEVRFDRHKGTVKGVMERGKESEPGSGFSRAGHRPLIRLPGYLQPAWEKSTWGLAATNAVVVPLNDGAREAGPQLWYLGGQKRDYLFDRTPEPGEPDDRSIVPR